MLNISKKPYHILLHVGLILILASLFFFDKNSVIDIHLHDTYFIIAHTHIFWLLAVLSLFVWAIYLITNKLLYSAKLSWMHIIITGLAIILLSFSPFLNNRIIYQNSRYLLNTNYRWTTAVAIAITVLIFGQIIFLVNLLLGLFTRRA